MIEIKSDGTSEGTVIVIDGVVQGGVQKFTFKVHHLCPWATIEINQIHVPKHSVIGLSTPSTTTDHKGCSTSRALHLDNEQKQVD